MIVEDHYVIKRKDSECIYSVRNPSSLFEIFVYYCSKYSKKWDEWDNSEVEDMKKIHWIRKQDYNQYSFHSVSESELDACARAIKYLANS